MSEENLIQHPDVQRKSRRTLLLVAFVCIAPFVAAWTLYFFWQPTGRINYGALIENVTLPQDKLTLYGANKPFELAQLRGHWVFVTVDSGACDEFCRQKLWKMRQVRLTQGKYLERIERAWLLSDRQSVAAPVLKEYDGTWVTYAQDSAVLKALPFSEALRNHIFLVDPLGNVVLRYPRDANPSLMKKDLERLLKVSRIG